MDTGELDGNLKLITHQGAAARYNSGNEDDDLHNLVDVHRSTYRINQETVSSTVKGRILLSSAMRASSCFIPVNPH